MHQITGILLFVALLAACSPASQPWHGTDVSGHLPDLAFSLVDEQGQSVTAQDFRGRTTVLFFGFTSCPGPCPATLGRLGVALDAMGARASGVQVLLVTVDPGRDTPEALAEYAGRFGSWLHGLTGTPDELQRLRETFGVAAQQVPGVTDGEYDVQHGTAVLVFDGDGQCRLVISDTSDPDAVAADLLRLVGENA